MISNNANIKRDHLDKMVGSMVHRGPDDRGVYLNPNKKKDYLFDEKFKIWMEHLYNIKTYNIFEIYKYDLFTARTTPLDHKKIRAQIDRLRIAVSQEKLNQN